MVQENNKIQVNQMREAIAKVLALGPRFLAKEVPAEEMAQTMVKAVQDYAKQAEKGGYLQPESETALELQNILRELMGCGSGFLAQRCDADCVARTIDYMVHEFSDGDSV